MFGTTSVDRSGPAVLKSIQDLGQFEAASGYYELVVDVEKDVKPVPRSWPASAPCSSPPVRWTAGST